jgi:hypothetical protein
MISGLSFDPLAVLSMEAVPAHYVHEMVKRVWPGFRFISRKPTNHSAQLYDMNSCEVVGGWGSNTKAFRYLWDLANRGVPLPSVGHSMGLGPAPDAYSKVKVQCLIRDMNHLLQEIYEWISPDEIALVHHVEDNRLDVTVTTKE